MPTRSYDEELLERVTDPAAAAEYLTACFKDTGEVFLLGLRTVVEARGGVRQLAELTELNRESLYRLLSEDGNPRLTSLTAILHALGIQLRFVARPA